MLEFWWDVVEEEAFDLGVAAIFWAASLVYPFRRIEARPEIRWDVIGAVTVVAFAYAVTMVLDVSGDWLKSRNWIAGWHQILDRWHWAAVVVAYVVFSDLCAYWSHRALHTRALWAQHAWHHSCKHLYWASGLRGSFLDTLVLFMSYSLAYVVFPRTEAGWVGVALFFINVANQHYIHSNLAIPFVKPIERFLVTPRYHFVHHSARKELGNSNYGFLFTFWDKVFGTYTDPDTVSKSDPLGLDYEAENWRLLIGLPPRSKPSEESRGAACQSS